MGCLMGRVDAMQYYSYNSSSRTAHFIAPGLGRIVKTRGPRRGPGGAAYVDAHISWTAVRQYFR